MQRRETLRRVQARAGRALGLLMACLAAAGCTAALGINKDYRELDGGAGEGGSGGSASGSASGATCDLIHKANPTAPSGVYTLDPDGAGNAPPFQAYCEMVADGGGWTLVLKIDGTKPTFAWTSPLWQDSNLYQPEKPDLDTNEAKLASFSTVTLNAVRLGMIDAGVTRWIMIEFTTPFTLSSLLTSGQTTATTIGRAEWQKLVASPSLQLYCNAEGFNVDPSNNGRVRIGIVGNEQNDCSSPDSFLGFGGEDGNGASATGNFAKLQPEHGQRTTVTFGYVMVR